MLGIAGCDCRLLINIILSFLPGVQMKLLTNYKVSAGIVLGLLSNVSLASAEAVDCVTLKDAIAASQQDFSTFRGARRDLPPDPELAQLQDIEGLSYTRDEYATERRLAAATSCSVIVVRAEDPESIISEARFVCYWPSTGKNEARFAALKKAVQACAIKAQAEDDDTDGYLLTINRVESGEGWSAVSVSADPQFSSIDAGASVSVVHAVCQAKTAGGCDDAD